MSTDYNPYQGATYAQMATYLSSKSGLDYRVALNWLHAEGSQQKGNPLGVDYTAKTGPRLFASWQAGLDRAVQLLTTSSNYKNIVSAIRSGNPAAERAAIVASPWSGSSHYGGGAHFPTAGITGAVPAATPSSSPASSPGTVVILQPSVKGIGLYPIPRDSIGKANVQCAAGYVPAVVSVGPIQTLQGFVSPQDTNGAANACVLAGTQEGARPDSSGIVTGAIPSIFGNFSWLPGLAVNLAILGLGGFLIISGASQALSPAAGIARDNPELLA
jgi:hypothetical protein